MMLWERGHVAPPLTGEVCGVAHAALWVWRGTTIVAVASSADGSAKRAAGGGGGGGDAPTAGICWPAPTVCWPAPTIGAAPPPSAAVSYRSSTTKETRTQASNAGERASELRADEFRGTIDRRAKRFSAILHSSWHERAAVKS